MGILKFFLREMREKEKRISMYAITEIQARLLFRQVYYTLKKLVSASTLFGFRAETEPFKGFILNFSWCRFPCHQNRHKIDDLIAICWPD